MLQKQSQAISDALEESFATIDDPIQDEQESLAAKIDFGPEDLDEESITSEQPVGFEQFRQEPIGDDQSKQGPIKFEQSVTPSEDRDERPLPDILNVDPPISNVGQDKSLTDWSIRTIPDPPSGFKDSESSMIPNGDEVNRKSTDSTLHTFAGPMQFSIDSYTERSSKEEPYVAKLSRTESLTSSDALPGMSLLGPGSSKTLPALNKAESFSVSTPRLNGAISGERA